jgi:hypothetical protein
MSVPIDNVSIISSKFKIQASKAVNKPETILAKNGVLYIGKSFDNDFNIKPSSAIE